MDPNNQIATPSQPQASGTSQISSAPRINWAWSLLFLILGILIGAFGFWGYQNYLVKKAPVSIESSLTPTPTVDLTADWKTYTDDVLGIIYKLPSNFALSNENDEESPGETGTQYCLIYQKSLSHFSVKQVHAGAAPCMGGVFRIGSTSKNYAAGRSGAFGDLQGYRKNNDTYSAIFVGDREFALQPDLVSEKTNQNGFMYLKITGKNSYQDYGGDRVYIPIFGTPGEGYFGALVNITNPKYHGFNIQMKIDSKKDEKLFDQILSTFKFTE